MTNPYDHTPATPAQADSKTEAAKAVAGNATDRAAEVAGTAKEHAAQVKDTAVAVGSDVVDTAKAEVGNVVAEAKSAAQTLLDEAGTQFRANAETGQQKLAEVIRAVSDELGQMTSGTSTNGIATQFAGTAQNYSHKAASWLEGKGPDELMLDVRRYAARQPVTFLAIAAGAGFLASRLARGLQAAASDEVDTARFAGNYPRTGQYGDPQYGYDAQTRYATPSYDGTSEPAYGAQAGYARGTTEHTTGYSAGSAQFGTPGYGQPASYDGPVTDPGYDLDGYPVDGQEPRR